MAPQLSHCSPTLLVPLRRPLHFGFPRAPFPPRGGSFLPSVGSWLGLSWPAGVGTEHQRSRGHASFRRCWRQLAARWCGRSTRLQTQTEILDDCLCWRSTSPSVQLNLFSFCCSLVSSVCLFFNCPVFVEVFLSFYALPNLPYQGTEHFTSLFFVYMHESVTETASAHQQSRQTSNGPGGDSQKPCVNPSRKRHRRTNIQESSLCVWRRVTKP